MKTEGLRVMFEQANWPLFERRWRMVCCLYDATWRECKNIWKKECMKSITFMLPCIVIDFFLNNQPDALIIPILFCYKTLHVSGIFSVHHQEFSTVHSALVSFMHFHPDSAWKRLSETCMKLTSAECTVENSWCWAEKMPETCRIL